MSVRGVVGLVALALVTGPGAGSTGAVLAQGAGADGVPAGDAAEAVRILESASRLYADLDGFCADFEQTRVVPLLDQTVRSRGRLCQMHPGFLLMDFTDPDGDRIVSDGESLWVYYPSVDPDQVIRTSLGASGTTFDFHAEFLEDPGRRFEAQYLGRDSVTGRPTHVVSVRPRADAAYEEARVWLDVDRGLIRKVEIEEENESLRRVVLSEIRIDPDLSPDRFAFDVPDGVRVLDHSGAAGIRR